MIKWHLLTALKNKNEIEKQLRRIITGDTYGHGEDKWSVTELIQERSNIANTAKRIVSGVRLDGTPNPDGPMMGSSGLPLGIKLKVLTRQACMQTADGKPINMWDTTEVAEENYNGELCPNQSDKPEKGDVVWVKGDHYTHDDDGKRHTRKTKMALRARYEAEHGYAIKSDVACCRWTKYPVDKDGCITVTFAHALQCLQNRGKRIVVPEHTESKRGRKPKEGRRLITNWHFEEVLQKEKKKRTKTNDNPSMTAGD